MDAIFQNFSNLTWQQVVMWAIGGILIYLAIKKDMEPSLLLPMGFGAILVNIPMSGAITQVIDGVKEIGVLNVLFDGGIANELFPLLLFIGIGAMIDFEPLLTNPKLMLFGAEQCRGANEPFGMMKKLWNDWHDAGITSIEAARARMESRPQGNFTKPQRPQTQQNNLTDAQLQHLLVDLDQDIE